jgi:hypothetical protein
MLTFSPVTICLLLCLTLSFQSLPCPLGHFQEHQKCLPCSSLPNTLPLQTDQPHDHCICIEGYTWSLSANRCLVAEDSPRLLQDCDTATQYTSKSGACVNCPEAGSGYIGGGDGSACNCDAENNFVWSS